MAQNRQSESLAPPSDVPPEVQAAQLLIRIGSGYILSTALQVALQLGIPDALASGPRSAAELATAAGVREDPLYRVLRLLATSGVFDEQDGRRFALNPIAQILRRGAPGSMRETLLWISDPFHLRIYADAMHSLETGRPAAEQTLGMPVFEYFARHPQLSAVFNDAMTAFSAASVPAVLEAYDFSGIGTLVDVAGGHGELLLSVLRAHPGMRGILLDVDHVIAGARSRIEAVGLEGRCEAMTGDFFQSLPAGGDAYVLKHIIHDWDDPDATRILRAVGAALKGRPGGRVLLLESVITADHGSDFAKVLDLEMLFLPGGRERTADEFRALLAGAGFELTRIVPTRGTLSIIEASPAA